MISNLDFLFSASASYSVLTRTAQIFFSLWFSNACLLLNGLLHKPQTKPSTIACTRSFSSCACFCLWSASMISYYLAFIFPASVSCSVLTHTAQIFFCLWFSNACLLLNGLLHKPQTKPLTILSFFLSPSIACFLFFFLSAYFFQSFSLLKW